MDCKHASTLMHDYFDGDLMHEQAVELKGHLNSCPACSARFQQLEQTEMKLFATLRNDRISAPDSLVSRIMSEIPSQRRQQPWLKMIKRHPALTAAAIFLVVMLFSAVSLMKADDQLIVKVGDLDQVVINGHIVTVPEGSTVTGNLTVENGKAEILGNVEGNLTVVDGSYYQASTAHISGKVKSIDQALDWIWYRISNAFSDVAYR
ncbi:MAG TPA: zf-HC2 domain-containing protein [Paenibacillus sp.]